MEFLTILGLAVVVLCFLGFLFLFIVAVNKTINNSDIIDEEDLVGASIMFITILTIIITLYLSLLYYHPEKLGYQKITEEKIIITKEAVQ